MGCTLNTAVWDSGYSGKSESLLNIYNPNGIKIYKNSRVMQLLFYQLDSNVRKKYSGIYKSQ